MSKVGWGTKLTHHTVNTLRRCATTRLEWCPAVLANVRVHQLTALSGVFLAKLRPIMRSASEGFPRLLWKQKFLFHEVLNPHGDQPPPKRRSVPARLPNIPEDSHLRPLPCFQEACRGPEPDEPNPRPPAVFLCALTYLCLHFSLTPCHTHSIRSHRSSLCLEARLSFHAARQFRFAPSSIP